MYLDYDDEVDRELVSTGPVDLRFCGPYDHPQYQGEMNDGSTQTEQTYVPIVDQIEAQIRSGEFLEEYKRARYDFSDGSLVDESVDPDPTHFADPADIWLMQARLLGKRDQLVALEIKRRSDEAAAAAVTARAAAEMEAAAAGAKK